MSHKCVFLLIASSVCLAPLVAAAADPSSQDLQIVGRALSFKDGGKRAVQSVAVVYDETSTQSQREMQATMAVARGGLRIGDAVLKVVAVEQKQFVSSAGYDGVFSTSDVDQARLGGALSGNGVPCLTLDAQQVKSGACTVAVRSRPSVTISINSRNAASAQVRFATAFIMMVHEI